MSSEPCRLRHWQVWVAAEVPLHPTLHGPGRLMHVFSFHLLWDSKKKAANPVPVIMIIKNKSDMPVYEIERSS